MRVKLETPVAALLLSAGDTAIDTPFAGLLVSTVSVTVAGGGAGVEYAADTVILAVSFTVQMVAVELVHPFHVLKMLPSEVAGAVSVTVVPVLYVRVKLVVPPDALLLSTGETAIAAPFEGFVEFTVRV